jgi:hypothetical protein
VAFVDGLIEEAKVRSYRWPANMRLGHVHAISIVIEELLPVW